MELNKLNAIFFACLACHWCHDLWAKCSDNESLVKNWFSSSLFNTYLFPLDLLGKVATHFHIKPTKLDLDNFSYMWFKCVVFCYCFKWLFGQAIIKTCKTFNTVLAWFGLTFHCKFFSLPKTEHAASKSLSAMPWCHPNLHVESAQCCHAYFIILHKDLHELIW